MNKIFSQSIIQNFFAVETYSNFKSVKKHNKDQNFDQVEYLRMLESIKNFVSKIENCDIIR